MNFSAFIARRVAFNRQHSFSRFIIRLAVGATAVSVMAMILTVSFSAGFQHEVAKKMFDFSGHIRVQHFQPEKVDIAEEDPVEGNDTVLDVLRHNPDVLFAQSYATRYAILKGRETFEGVLLKGVEKNYHFENLDGFLRQGRWLNFPDSGYSSEIDISAYTAGKLQVKTGDRIFAWFIQSDGSRRVRPLTIAGIFRTGVEDYDKVMAIADLGLIRRLNGWTPGQIGGYEVFIRDVSRSDTVSKAIFEALPSGWNSYSIQDIYGSIFEWLDIPYTIIAIVIVIMGIVAILNLLTCLIILVLERTHMTGVLKSIGATNGNVQRIFLYHGAMITVAGILIGNIAGLAICWAQNRYGFIPLPEDAYFISKAAARLAWWQVPLIDLATFVVCFAALLIPVIIVRRVQPVAALRFQ